MQLEEKICNQYFLSLSNIDLEILLLVVVFVDDY